MDNELFEQLLQSVRQAGAIERGEAAPALRTIVRVPDVKKIRKRMKATQIEFADILGIDVANVRNWEQHRRVPEGSACTLLLVADKHPDILRELRAMREAEDCEAIA